MKNTINNILKSLPGMKRVRKKLDNQFERDEFVIAQLKDLRPGSVILDAGCGSQRYRTYCDHLEYKAQDFGQYTVDDKKMVGSNGAGGIDGYKYGNLDYVGNIWEIDEKDGTFDAILCTEVIEHIPYPNEAIKEFGRLLKPNGKLILTAPSNCLRHMDPYFFYTGFSDRWYENILSENNFRIEKLDAVGDYYSWLAVEIARAAMYNSFFSKLLLSPAFVYFYKKKKTPEITNTLCMGYHVVALKFS